MRFGRTSGRPANHTLTSGSSPNAVSPSAHRATFSRIGAVVTPSRRQTSAVSSGASRVNRRAMPASNSSARAGAAWWTRTRLQCSCGRISAATRSGVGGRVSERPDHLMKIPERPGPTVTEDQRHRFGAFARLVNEVNRHPINCGLEMGEGVDRLLLPAPVVALKPIVHQLFEIGEVGAVFPVGVGKVPWPASLGQTLAQVSKRLLRDGYSKRLFRHRSLLRAGLLS